jgi:hypothetical protein
MAQAAMILGGALETTDPTRARFTLQTALEHANAVDHPQTAGTSLAWLARMGTDVATPQWATQFRDGLALGYETGDTPMVLQHLDIYAQSLAATDRAEVGAVLVAAVEQLSTHISNPVSVAHRRITRAAMIRHRQHVSGRRAIP